MFLLVQSIPGKLSLYKFCAYRHKKLLPFLSQIWGLTLTSDNLVPVVIILSRSMLFCDLAVAARAVESRCGWEIPSAGVEPPAAPAQRHLPQWSLLGTWGIRNRTRASGWFLTTPCSPQQLRAPVFPPQPRSWARWVPAGHRQWQQEKLFILGVQKNYICPLQHHLHGTL